MSFNFAGLDTTEDLLARIPEVQKRLQARAILSGSSVGQSAAYQEEQYERLEEELNNIIVELQSRCDDPKVPEYIKNMTPENGLVQSDFSGC